MSQPEPNLTVVIPVHNAAPHLGACVESLLAHAAFSIPAVKGIEFGTGFGFADLRGSAANDAFRMDEVGRVVTRTNHNAGLNGAPATPRNTPGASAP